MKQINGSVNDIIKSIPGSGAAKSGQAMADIKAAEEQMLGDNKYPNRADLDRDGVGRVFDEMQSKLVFADKYETARKLASNKLQNQLQKLDEINQIKVEFQAKDNIIKGQEQEYAEQTLKKIENILNSQLNGEYIFGGKNSTLKPVNDLNLQSNIVNGRASTNYTDVSSIEIDSPISEKHSVNLGLISANDPAIANIIAAVNSYKAHNGHGSEVEIDKFLKAADGNLGLLQTKVRTAINNTVEAKDYNSRLTMTATEQVKEISGANLVSSADRFKGAIQSLYANFKIQEVKNSISDRLFGR